MRDLAELKTPPQTEQSSPLQAPLLPWLASHRELLYYAALMAVAALLRFWDLGSRALHHDESLHAFFSWNLFTGRGYQHDPLMHGPFQFYLTALVYFLFGASDYTARVPPALFGTALVGLPYLLRDRLGQAGAMVAAAILTFSPSLLYYSRFARNDIYIAVWTTALVICLWRYHREERPLYLYLSAALVALSFATKETTYINVALLGSFFVLLLLGNALGSRPTDPWPPTFGVVLLLGTLTLPQLAALTKLAWPWLGLPPGPGGTTLSLSLAPRDLAASLTVALLLGASALVGVLWRGRVWLLAAATFYGIYLLLFTTVFTNPGGFGSGLWGSLDYWLQQQGVRRGDQPGYYYPLLLLVYEFLPLALALAASVYYPVRRLGQGTLLLVAALAALGAGALGVTHLLGGWGLTLHPVWPQGLPWLALPFAPELLSWLLLPLSGVVLFWCLLVFRPRPFLAFLFYWCFAALVGYGLAAEKMPWLSLNLTLPVILLAALFLGEVLQRIPWRRMAAGRGILLAGLLPLLVWGLWSLVGRLASPEGFSPTPSALLGLFLLVAVWFGLALFALRLVMRLGVAVSAGLALLAALTILGLLTYRAALQASYFHGDVPVEMLIYTQTSPDVPRIRDEIERLSLRRTGGKELRITVDASQGFTWPWAWYLRDYKNVDYPTLSAPSGPPQGEVLLLNAVNEGAMKPYLDTYGPGQRFRLRWWFPEDYRGLTWERLWRELSWPQSWEQQWRYFLQRQPPSPLGSSDGIVYLPKGEAAPLPRVGVSAEDPYAGRRSVVPSILTVGGKGSAPGRFDGPRGMALDRDGNIYVVEGTNHRLQKFDPQGQLLAHIGGLGTAPGQLQEPWGVAVDAQGYVYVADTWNHRIQKFDPELRFVTQWGGPLTDNAGRREGNEGLFYGPRDIAIDAAGHLYVTDTGNKRIQKFDSNGRFLESYGGEGTLPGRFREPVGIASDGLGNLYVADTWNRRIQVFASDFRFLRQIPLAGWAGESVLNKPYLTVDPRGYIYATDPESHQVWRFAPDGSLAHLIGRPGVGSGALNLPIGIAADSQGTLYVAEAGNHRVQRFPPWP